MPKHLIISTAAPGDITVLTALVRDIQLSRPGEFIVDVETTSPELWQNNPYVTSFRRNPPKDCLFYKADYGLGLRESEYRTVHFMAYFHEDFFNKIGIKVTVMKPFPDLHLSEAEKTTRPIANRYWACLPGGKTDFTAKMWGVSSWATLVADLADDGIACVQLGNSNTRGEVKHINPEVPGMALNLVGKTTLRELLRLIYHAEGVICGVTCAMHMAAAMQKPCVVLAASRESWWWEAYTLENSGLAPPEVVRQLKVPHRFLHNIGQLDCARHHGCGKGVVLPTNPNTGGVCINPVVMPGQAVPLCLHVITPAMVRTAVLSYYADLSIPDLPAGLRRLKS